MAREHKENKDAPERVKAALEAKLSPDELTTEEQEVWLDEFMERTATLTPEAKAFFEDRRRLGLGVGLDENGILVRGSDPMERAKAALDGIIKPGDLTEEEWDVDPDLIFVSPFELSGRNKIEYLNVRIMFDGAADRDRLVETVEDALSRLPTEFRAKFGRSTSEGWIVISETSGIWFDDR
ncbi:hypothetical protein [Ruegeria arenilitoris]|uniref:hypothetical protein n=1 Tax=Ruegeria arenilitoris TaxID=1173585 RepID=UPI00147C0B3C|nr:hypothetical protein [Ruegeria arenilitoris]